MPNNDFLIADYLLQRLSEIGVDHIFGIPGDFVMPFFTRMAASKLHYVGCCNELNAGYAADGYARVQGVGAAIVTGGVGSLSIINAVAGAYAEDVPVIVISGGPSVASFKTQPKIHHTIPGNFRAPLKMMAEVTAVSVLLDDPATATTQIDHAITACLTTRKPVYIEIPIDTQKVLCQRPIPLTIAESISSKPSERVTKLVADLVNKIDNSARTVICVGHEVERFGLQAELKALIETTGLPVASMMFGKAGYVETLKSCMGLYMGALSPQDIRNYVEESDIVIFIGAHETDLNMGSGTSKLQPSQCVFVRENEALINSDIHSNIPLGDFILEFGRQMKPVEGLRFADQPIASFTYKRAEKFQPVDEAALTTTRFYQRLVHFIRPGDVIAADASAGINCAHFQLQEDNISITTPYWASMGMCFGAAVGASFAPNLCSRVIAIEGDGSLLMTIQELSTLARYKKPAIVFVLNNKGYSFERLIHDGEFNDIPQWRYNKLEELIPGCNSLEVSTEGELESALLSADTYSEQGPLIIELHLDAHDIPELFDVFTRFFRS